ncbi:cytochrome B561 [Tolumonas auensis DSM 9187]|uniref:Cytochrome B561 n=1 Tax=Tolumonas auensis (strain DSM 9187 / NBRC 110442 / TA 4) TaxID=595494 RepID=C4LA55_TOLAT|nr:cytochrome b [Tolumonas auensis]ACQ92184.1 cytochrome B561 [Tolumonas auensis DSM 9187]
MSSHYTKTAKSLHWLMAILFFGMLGLGFYMQGLPLSPEKLKLYSWHKWTGVTVFLLALIRLAWRVTHQPPALPQSMPRLMQVAAHAGHHMLYMLMFLIPLSGWLMSSAKGFQTVWFGILPIPDLLEKNKELGDLLLIVHVSLNYLFIAVLVGHIGAALKHHFIDKDDILTRMLPGSAKDK